MFEIFGHENGDRDANPAVDDQLAGEIFVEIAVEKAEMDAS
jgi:hypothetical protein